MSCHDSQVLSVMVGWIIEIIEHQMNHKHLLPSSQDYSSNFSFRQIKGPYKNFENIFWQIPKPFMHNVNLSILILIEIFPILLVKSKERISHIYFYMEQFTSHKFTISFLTSKVLNIVHFCLSDNWKLEVVPNPFKIWDSFLVVVGTFVCYYMSWVWIVNHW